MPGRNGRMSATPDGMKGVLEVSRDKRKGCVLWILKY